MCPARAMAIADTLHVKGATLSHLYPAHRPSHTFSQALSHLLTPSYRPSHACIHPLTPSYRPSHMPFIIHHLTRSRNTPSNTTPSTSKVPPSHTPLTHLLTGLLTPLLTHASTLYPLTRPRNTLSNTPSDTTPSTSKVPSHPLTPLSHTRLLTCPLTHLLSHPLSRMHPTSHTPSNTTPSTRQRCQVICLLTGILNY